MKLSTLLFVAAAVLAVAVGLNYLLDLPATRATLTPADQAMLGQGRQIYADHCADCHGINLEGQPNWRERNADGKWPAPPHDETGHTWHHGDAELFELTKRGPQALVGGDYQSDMPAFDGVLSDDQITAVLSFIKSTWPIEIQARHDGVNSAQD